MKKISNKLELEKLMSEDKLILIHFYEDWCPVCDAMYPTMESIENCYSDRVTVARINVNESPSLKIQFGVSSIPTVFFLKDQKIVDRVVGLQNQLELEVRVERYSSKNPEVQAAEPQTNL